MTLRLTFHLCVWNFSETFFFAPTVFVHFFTLTISPRISLIYFLKILGMSWHICFCCLSFYSFENSQIYNNIYLPPQKKNNHNPLTSVQNIKYYAKSFNILPISLKFKKSNSQNNINSWFSIRFCSCLRLFSTIIWLRPLKG